VADLVCGGPKGREQLAAGVRQSDAARGSLEEPAAEAVFQRSYGLANRGADDAQLRSRGAKARVIGDGEKFRETGELVDSGHVLNCKLHLTGPATP